MTQGHRVSNHAVNADGGQNQRHHRERHRKSHDERPRCAGVLDVRLERAYVIDWQHRINAFDRFANQRHQGGWLTRGLDDIDGWIARHLSLWEVHLLTHVFNPAAMPDMSHDADAGRGDAWLPDDKWIDQQAFANRRLSRPR